MKKRVKNGIVKHYCDICGKSIYDTIPKEPTLKFMGMYIPEVSIKRHAEYFIGSKGEYCKECFSKMDKK